MLSLGLPDAGRKVASRRPRIHMLPQKKIPPLRKLSAASCTHVLLSSSMAASQPSINVRTHHHSPPLFSPPWLHPSLDSPPPPHLLLLLIVGLAVATTNVMLRLPLTIVTAASAATHPQCKIPQGHGVAHIFAWLALWVTVQGPSPAHPLPHRRVGAGVLIPTCCGYRLPGRHGHAVLHGHLEACETWWLSSTRLS